MSYENEATNTLERKAYLSILGLETSELSTNILARMAYIQMIEGGGTPTGDFIGVPSDLYSNKNYKFVYDTTQEKIKIVKLEMGKWVDVVTLGSVETSMIVSNKAFGGFRGVGADGYEYFIGRISTGGDGRSVILGSFDTGNYLACSDGYMMVHKLEEPVLIPSPNQTLNKYEGFFDSIVFSFTAVEDCLIDKIIFEVVMPFKDIYFNTFVTNEDETILYSDILDDDVTQDLWARGKRVEKFKISRETGEQEFLMPQPIPVRKDQTIKIHYQFSAELEFNCGEDSSVLWKLKGNKLKATNVSTFTTGDDEEKKKLIHKKGMVMYDSDKKDFSYNIGNNWVSLTGSSSSAVPQQCFTFQYPVKGKETVLTFEQLDITENDYILISCGSSGMATEVDDFTKLKWYNCAYLMDRPNKKLTYFIETQGTSPRIMNVYKFVGIPPLPTPSQTPYMTIIDVLEDIEPWTKKGTVFNVEIETKNTSAIMKPYIQMQSELGSMSTELILDSGNSYHFLFPMNMNEYWKTGTEYTHQLFWQDKNGLNYTGLEVLTKTVI